MKSRFSTSFYACKNFEAREFELQRNISKNTKNKNLDHKFGDFRIEYFSQRRTSIIILHTNPGVLTYRSPFASAEKKSQNYLI